MTGEVTGQAGKRSRSRRLALVLLGGILLAGAAWLGWTRWSTNQLLRQGQEALAARDYTRSREFLERYLELRPRDTQARLLVVRAARLLHHYPEALAHLFRCEEDGGDAEEIAIERGLIEVQRGDERPVAALEQRTRKGDERALVILEVLIQHNLETYQLRKALHQLTVYLERRPTDLAALLGRGFVWERFLSFADALTDYRKAVEAHPESERARLHLGETLLRVGTPAEALTQYQWLAERHPEKEEVRLGLACCQRQLGQLEKAREGLEALLAESPENGEALWERGQLALAQGSAAEGEPWFRRAAKVLPYDRRVHYSLYRCLLDQGRTREAEACNARVAEIDADLRRIAVLSQKVMERPYDATLRCEGGVLFLRNGEEREGIRWLEIALRIDPNCEPARKALQNRDKGKH